MPNYKITITAIEEKATTKRGAWTVVEKRPWTVDECNDSPSGLVINQPIKDIMGYAPDVTTTEVVETPIYTQTVSALALKKVIAAINDMPTIGG